MSRKLASRALGLAAFAALAFALPATLDVSPAMAYPSVQVAKTEAQTQARTQTQVQTQAPAKTTTVASAPAKSSEPVSAQQSPPENQSTPTTPSPKPAPKHNIWRKARKRSLAETILRNAKRNALVEPTAVQFEGASEHFVYQIGKIYSLNAAPGYVTTLALRPGETLTSKAAGDTANWTVTEATDGSGATSRVLLLVKPVEPGLHTNFVISTTQRTYLIEAVSRVGAYSSFIDWRYPLEEAEDLRLQNAARTLRGLAGNGAAGGNAQDAAAGPDGLLITSRGLAGAPRLDPTSLNFNYKIEAGQDHPIWSPVQVFDDGSKTYIRFPETIANTDIPPLFILSPDGKDELVNYRFLRGYYVVDRLFENAELRIGTKKFQRVVIHRIGSRRTARENDASQFSSGAGQ